MDSMQTARDLASVRLLTTPPALTLDALLTEETSLKREFIFRPPPRKPRSEQMDPAELLERSVRFLELNLLLVGLAEAALTVHPFSRAQVEADAERLYKLVSGSTGLDPSAVVDANPVLAGMARHRAPNGADPDLGDPAVFRDAIVRQAHGTVVGCPIDALVEIAKSIHRPALGHRCQLAYDRLHSVVRRSSAEGDARFRMLGQAYAEGRLSLDEVVTLSGMARPDVLALLEQHGYARSLDVIVTSTERSREAVLAAARTDRFRRDGKPALDLDLLRRDVIASQRIEDVNARQWLPPEPE